MSVSMWEAMQHIKECLVLEDPSIFGFCGWSDLQYKHTFQELKDKIGAGDVSHIATIRPMTIRNLSDDGYGHVSDRLEVSIVLASPVKKNAEVEAMVEYSCGFPYTLRKAIFERADTETQSGFTQFSVTEVLFPIREHADDYSIADARVSITNNYIIGD